MARKTKKKAARRRRKQDPLLALDDQQRLAIYHRLISTPAVRRRAQEIAEELLTEVSVEEIRDQVSEVIEAADLDEVYAHSGRTAYGYVDPYEHAREYLDRLMEPFLDDLRRRLEQGRVAEAKSICMGIVLGLYEHRQAGLTTDEVLGLDPDFPWEAAGDALDALRGKRRGRRAKKAASPKASALPEAFWRQVPDWSDLRR